MQRILERKTPTRLKFWFCGFLYCNLPLAVAGFVVVMLHEFACSTMISGWVIGQSTYILVQPFFTLPFFVKPTRCTKNYFLFVSVVFLIFQVTWMIVGSVLLAWSDGQQCHALNTPTWTVMLVQDILGYLGVLQLVGTIFEASGLEVDNIGYSQLSIGSV